MLLIDAIEAIEVDADASFVRVRARRTIDPNDPVFVGHFPAQPVYPGVLLIETMAQAALAALPFASGDPSRDGFSPPGVRFTRVRDAAFYAPVLPGDTIEVHAEASDDGLIISALGQVFRGDTLCAYAISEAQIHDE